MLRYIIFLLFLNSSVFSQDKVKFTAAGVTCSMCSKAIQKSLSKNRTILTIEPNLDTQEWNLEVKKDEFKVQDLIKSVEDAGFSISKLYFNGELLIDNTKKNKSKKTKIT